MPREEEHGRSRLTTKVTKHAKNTKKTKKTSNRRDRKARRGGACDLRPAWPAARSVFFVSFVDLRVFVVNVFHAFEFSRPTHSAYNPRHERPHDGLSAHPLDHLPPRRIALRPPRDRLARGRQVYPPLQLRRLRGTHPPPRPRPPRSRHPSRRPRRHARLEPRPAPRGVFRHPPHRRRPPHAQPPPSSRGARLHRQPRGGSRRPRGREPALSLGAGPPAGERAHGDRRRRVEARRRRIPRVRNADLQGA